MGEPGSALIEDIDRTHAEHAYAAAANANIPNTTEVESKIHKTE